MADNPNENVIELLEEPPVLLDDHADSVDPLSVRSNITHNLNERITAIDYGQNLSFVEQEIKRRYRDLPAQKDIGNIKFLGSSFSGVDIKVVAHMYDQRNIKDERLKELEYQANLAASIIDACNSLLSGGLTGLADVATDPSALTYNEKRRRFIFAAGLSTVDTSDEYQKARDILVSNIFKNGNFTFLGVARMQRATEVLKRSSEAEYTELEGRLSTLNNMEKLETSSTVTLGSLQTISVQTFREKNAVRALGHTYPKGFTRGTRTIGGSCIFTIFDENALADLIRGMSASTTYGERDHELSTLIPDQLPPLDLTIIFANEYGALSDFRLYGVEFFTDGSVFSIEDLLSEETMNFVCRDADIMTSRGRISISRLQRGMHNGKDDKDKSGTSLLFDNQDYYEYLDRLGVRRRLLNR